MISYLQGMLSASGKNLQWVHKSLKNELTLRWNTCDVETKSRESTKKEFRSNAVAATHFWAKQKSSHFILLTGGRSGCRWTVYVLDLAFCILQIVIITASPGCHWAVRTTLLCIKGENTRETAAPLFRRVKWHLATATRGPDTRWSVGDLSRTAQLIGWVIWCQTTTAHCHVRTRLGIKVWTTAYPLSAIICDSSTASGWSSCWFQYHSSVATEMCVYVICLWTGKRSTASKSRRKGIRWADYFTIATLLPWRIKNRPATASMWVWRLVTQLATTA